MKRYLYFLMLPCIIYSGCWTNPVDPDNDIDSNGKVNAWVPVYDAGNTIANSISLSPKRATTVGGKIFVIGDKLFQVEEGLGIHIIDYHDKTNPQKLGFLNIPGSREVALKGTDLYSNSDDDLVVIDLAQYPTVAVKVRSEGAFPDMANNKPPASNVYYVCPDPAKGRVIRWERKKIKVPQCHN